MPAAHAAPRGRGSGAPRRPNSVLYEPRERRSASDDCAPGRAGQCASRFCFVGAPPAPLRDGPPPARRGVQGPAPDSRRGPAAFLGACRTLLFSRSASRPHSGFHRIASHSACLGSSRNGRSASSRTHGISGRYVAALIQLRHGHPEEMLHEKGREVLEQRLENHFSKWVWQWDVEHQRASPLHASAPPPTPMGIVAETVPELGGCTFVDAEHLAKPLQWFDGATSAMDGEKPLDLVLLRDDQVLWPTPHSSEATEGVGAQDRRKTAMYVLAHLVGLEKAREDDVKARARAHASAQAQDDEPGLLSQPFPGAGAVADFFSGSSAWLGLDKMWLGEGEKRPSQSPSKPLRTSSPLASKGKGSASETPPKRGPKETARLAKQASTHLAPIDTKVASTPPPTSPAQGVLPSLADSPVSTPVAPELDQEPQETQLPASLSTPDTLTEANTDIPFPVRLREPAKLFTTSAPFQAFHERISQAIGTNKDTDAEAPTSSTSETAPLNTDVYDVTQANAACVVANLPEQQSSPLRPAIGKRTTEASVPQVAKEQAVASFAPVPAPAPSTPPFLPRSNSERQFPAMSASRAAWYNSPARPSSPATYLPHDPALDGWGNETPAQWHHAHLALDDGVHITYTTVRRPTDAAQTPHDRAHLAHETGGCRCMACPVLGALAAHAARCKRRASACVRQPARLPAHGRHGGPVAERAFVDPACLERSACECRGAAPCIRAHAPAVRIVSDAGTMSKRRSRAKRTVRSGSPHALRTRTATMPRARSWCCTAASSGATALPSATTRCAAWPRSTATLICRAVRDVHSSGWRCSSIHYAA